MGIIQKRTVYQHFSLLDKHCCPFAILVLIAITTLWRRLPGRAGPSQDRCFTVYISFGLPYCLIERQSRCYAVFCYLCTTIILQCFFCRSTIEPHIKPQLPLVIKVIHVKYQSPPRIRANWSLTYFKVLKIKATHSATARCNVKFL